MLDLSRMNKSVPNSMQNEWNQRLPNKLSCLGPETIGQEIRNLDTYWNGEVHGDMEDDGYISNAQITMINPRGDIFTSNRWSSSQLRRYFSIAFDLSGNLEHVSWETNNKSYYHFFHSLLNEWVTYELPDGSYSPVFGLDYFGGTFVDRSIDVVLVYIHSNELYVRYQRERFDIEHKLEGFTLPNNARIRSCGFTSDWRFGIRFYEPI